MRERESEIERVCFCLSVSSLPAAFARYGKSESGKGPL